MESIVEENKVLMSRPVRCLHWLKFRFLPRAFLSFLHICGFMPCSEDEFFNKVFVGVNVCQQIFILLLVGVSFSYHYEYRRKSMWFYTMIGNQISKYCLSVVLNEFLVFFNFFNSILLHVLICSSNHFIRGKSH